jgi:hypothetical protein
MLKLHDEIKKNEIFVGNIKATNDLSYLKNIRYRVGKQSYTIDGRELGPTYMLPLYIFDVDYEKYNQIMLERAK